MKSKNRGAALPAGLKMAAGIIAFLFAIYTLILLTTASRQILQLNSNLSGLSNLNKQLESMNVKLAAMPKMTEGLSNMQASLSAVNRNLAVLPQVEQQVRATNEQLRQTNASLAILNTTTHAQLVLAKSGETNLQKMQTQLAALPDMSQGLTQTNQSLQSANEGISSMKDSLGAMQTNLVDMRTQLQTLSEVAGGLNKTTQQLETTNQSLQQMSGSLGEMKLSMDHMAQTTDDMDRQLKSLPKKVAIGAGIFGIFEALK